MNKIAVIENQHWDKTHFLNYVLESLCEKHGCSAEILEYVGNIPKEQIIKTLSECDTIMFATTWIYQDSVYALGKLLGSQYVGPKNVYYFGENNISRHLEEIFSLQELADLVKHKMFIINHSLIDKEDWCTPYDLLQYKTAWEEEERLRKEKNQSFKRTGRTVLIKKIQAQGSQWSNLKEGDVVDELDCSEIDPNPNRGTWVMGLDEPVKLLNDSGYDEWEYSEAKCDWLAREFHLRGERGQEHDSIHILAEWINRCSGSLILTDAELWIECDRICSLVGVERRGNRHHFERRLKQHREKYVHFRERRPRAVVS